eukprot:5928994-Pleurochrysis_carterae.AAC.1
MHATPLPTIDNSEAVASLHAFAHGLDDASVSAPSRSSKRAASSTPPGARRRPPNASPAAPGALPSHVALPAASFAAAVYTRRTFSGKAPAWAGPFRFARSAALAPHARIRPSCLSSTSVRPTVGSTQTSGSGFRTCVTSAFDGASPSRASPAFVRYVRERTLTRAREHNLRRMSLAL